MNHCVSSFRSIAMWLLRGNGRNLSLPPADRTQIHPQAHVRGTDLRAVVAAGEDRGERDALKRTSCHSTRGREGGREDASMRKEGERESEDGERVTTRIADEAYSHRACPPVLSLVAPTRGTTRPCPSPSRRFPRLHKTHRRC